MKYLILLLLAGCTTVYEHPTKSDAEFKIDRYECEREATLATNEAALARRLMRHCMEARGWSIEK